MNPEYVGMEHFNGRVGLLSGVSFVGYRHQDSYMDTEAQQMFLFIDGAMYVVQEDPDDGYRSYMKDRILVADTMPINIWLPPEEIIGKHVEKDSDRYGRDGNDEHQYYTRDACDVMELWSTKTNLCVVEFGTDYTDDYYPVFTSAFHPQNMSINKRKADLLGESDEV